jgi:hypothetical protein
VTLEELGSLGEFVSAVVVVLSLVYLARQVRHNTESLRTENYARALERVAVLQSRLSTDASLATVFARGVIGPAALSVEERIQFTWAFYEMFGAFEFMFHQAESGALSGEVWSRWSATLAWWISLPGVRAWWESKPTPFTATFSAVVDGFIAANPADPEAAKRWERFLRGEVAGQPPGWGSP